jgi:mevalonate kinase
MQIFEDSDEKQYDKISIRKFVLNNFRENVLSKSMMKKKISSSKKSQLFTFDDASSFKLTSINNFVAVEISRFLSRKETSDKKMINLSRKNQSLNKKNNISSRKKVFFVQTHRSYRMNSSKLKMFH